MKDLYSILNVSKSSNDNEIKKAYKKLAFQYHPDKNKSKDSEIKFKEISEAYEILTNQDKRRMYDNFGYDSISGDLPPINPMDLFQYRQISFFQYLKFYLQEIFLFFVLLRFSKFLSYDHFSSNK